ncbi:MAG TPA: transposase [Gemmatimonadales bacterium]|nr:transposase [Gemmatimonadales bacterium]
MLLKVAHTGEPFDLERRREIVHLLVRWRLVREQLAELEAAIEALAPACPELRALMTVPEVGAICAATLVAELGTPQDHEHPRQILKMAGLNLDGRDSASMVGRKCLSKRGRPMLRRQLYLLAGRWALPRGLYHADHAVLKARYGGLGTKAICTLARRLVPLLFALMKTGTPFDKARGRAPGRACARRERGDLGRDSAAAAPSAVPPVPPLLLRPPGWGQAR